VTPSGATGVLCQEEEGSRKFKTKGPYSLAPQKKEERRGGAANGRGEEEESHYGKCKDEGVFKALRLRLGSSSGRRELGISEYQGYGSGCELARWASLR